MAKLGINTGTNPNDGSGDSLLAGAVKINSNFNEIYAAIGNGSTVSTPVTSITAGTGINLSGSTGSVTITNTGIANTNNLRTDFLEVSGISTLSGGLTVTGNATATQFVGGGAGITGISTLNIVNYSGGGSGSGVGTDNVRTNSLVVSGVSTFTGNVSFASSALFGDSDKILLGADNDFEIYHSTFNRIVSVGVLTIDSDDNINLDVDDTVNIRGGTGSNETLAKFVTNGSVELYYDNAKKFETTGYGITVSGGVYASGILTATSYTGYDYLQAPFGSTVNFAVTVASKDASHRYNGSGSGSAYLINGIQSPFLTLTPGRTYRFTHDNTGSHPLKFYLESDKTTLYSTGVTFNDAYTEIVVSDTTPQVLHYQCTNHSLMGNAVYVNSNKLQTPYTVSVGAGSSINGVDSPSLTLSHNNPTVVGTSGTTGQVKQIGGQPYYYDGTTWRALFLVGAASTVNQADSDWDNTMIRMNFDQATIGDVTNLKDGRTPTTSQVDLVSSPIKYGTKSARFQDYSSGIKFTQNNSGSTYYPFEGAWTLEGWFYFDSSNLPTVTNITNSSILFSNYHQSIGTNYNWRIGYYYSGASSIYNFYWNNRNSSDTGSNGAGNVNTGFLLQQLSSVTFADNAWHHIAIVREPGNGSIHFYFDGNESNKTGGDELIDNDISDQTNQSFNIGYYGISADSGQFEGNIDDIRVSKSARYTDSFTPPASALPITGSTTTVYEPADSKVGEISLGGSPAWTGTPGVTASQIAAGQYRATFATAYSNATDYVIQTSMNDYTPATTPVGIGVSRFTTHADFFIRRVSDGANIDTGSLAIDLFKK
jgi:hypothetical protein